MLEELQHSHMRLEDYHTAPISRSRARESLLYYESAALIYSLECSIYGLIVQEWTS